MRHLSPHVNKQKASATSLPATATRLSVQCIFGHVRTKKTIKKLISVKRSKIFRHKN